MNREEAIAKLIAYQLNALTSEQRKEQLETMYLENWSECDGWEKLPGDLISEHDAGQMLESPNSSRYDPMLKLWLKDSLAAVSNSYLIEKLRDFDENVDFIEGTPATFQACPCCGRRTLGSRGEYDICPVCWWEDDGQDNEQACEEYGGPNSGVSLSRARLNFLSYGIYDPKRKDLFAKKDPESKYELGREFRLLDDGTLVEVGTDYKVKIDSNP